MITAKEKPSEFPVTLPHCVSDFGPPLIVVLEAKPDSTSKEAQDDAELELALRRWEDDGGFCPMSSS